MPRVRRLRDRRGLGLVDDTPTHDELDLAHVHLARGRAVPQARRLVTRKVFDDSKGVHVAKPGTVAPAEIFEPLVDPFAFDCPRCAAKAGDPCVALSSASKDEKRFPHPLRVDAAWEARR
jgi:hypothetical protein